MAARKKATDSEPGRDRQGQKPAKKPTPLGTDSPLTLTDDRRASRST